MTPAKTENRAGPEPVAVYARVSSETQEREGTIETQLAACREYAARRGWDIMGIYRDEAVSGAVPFAQRPAAARLLQDAEAKRFSRVLVARGDRLARDLLEGITAVRRLAALGVQVTSVAETWDDTPAGRLTFSIFMSFASFERDLIRERTAAGRHRKVREGAYMAPRPPYGYRKDPATGNLVVYEPEAAVIRRIFRMCTMDGLGLWAIAARLTQDGVPPPEPAIPGRRRADAWSPTTVHRFLTNSRYYGETAYGATRLNGKAVLNLGPTPMHCPPIIDRATFEAAQAALKRRMWRAKRNTRHDYLLQGLAYCGVCGNRCGCRMVKAGTGKGYRGYWCSTGHNSIAGAIEHKGRRRLWKAEPVEQAVLAHLEALMTDPNRFRQAITASLQEARRRQLQARLADMPEREATLEGMLDGLAAEADRLITLAGKGIISDEELARHLGRIREEQAKRREELAAIRENAEIQAAQQALERVEAILADAERLPDSYLTALRLLPGMAMNGDQAALRELLGKLVDRVVLLEDGSIRLEGPVMVDGAPIILPRSWRKLNGLQ